MTRRSKSTLRKSAQRGYLRAVTRGGVGVCLPCGESFETADDWKAHNAGHVGRGEHLCALCGLTFPKQQFSWHPCAATLSAESATGASLHPSCAGEERTERNGNHTAEPRHLSLVPRSSPTDSQDTP